MILLLSLLATAHRLESGVLALREVESGRYAVRWSPPATAPLEPMPVLDCEQQQSSLWVCGADGPARIEAVDGAWVIIERRDGDRMVHSLPPARPRANSATTPGFGRLRVPPFSSSAPAPHQNLSCKSLLFPLK